MKCDYCQQPTELVTGEIIYPHRADLAAKQFWRCIPCAAYVGCHPGTENPLGRLANAELRAAKMRAHAAFDPLWTDRRLTRAQAYGWLAKQLGIKKKETHIGWFDLDQCRRVVEVCASDEAKSLRPDR